MRASEALGILLLALASGCAVGAQPLPHASPAATDPASRGHCHRRFEDAAHWARVFDDPARDAWQKPDEVVTALELAPDSRVADLGAGTGYFAVRLVRRVPEGVVYAVDVERDMVRHLGERARHEGLENLVPVLAAPGDARLPEAVDLVLVVDTYHHIADRPAYFRRLSASLRPGGRLAIVDFTPESPIGPPAVHRIPAETVAQELRDAGYAQRATHSFLPNQYFLVFSRQP